MGLQASNGANFLGRGSFIAFLGRVTLVVMLAFSMVTVTTDFTPPAEAQFFKKLKKGLKKTRRKVRRDVRKLRKNKKLRKVVGAAVAVGVGAAVGRKVNPVAGIAAAAAVIAVTNPQVRANIQRSFGNQVAWAGCTNCNKRRITVAPGRKISKKRRRLVTAEMKQDTRDIQTALKTLGHYKIKVDGDYGPGTRRGVKAYQASIGEPPSNRLTGAQRARLFYDAANAGYLREGATQRKTLARFVVPQNRPTQNRQIIADPASPKATQAVIKATPSVKKIKEFRLAGRVQDRFAASVLLAGPITALAATQLKPGGMIEGTLLDKPEEKITFGAEEISFTKHELSDEWVVVQLDRDPPVVLNTLDTFADAAEADAFIRKAVKDQTILAKLSERKLPLQPEPEVIIAAVKPEQIEQESAKTEFVKAPEPKTDRPDTNEQTTSEIAETAAPETPKGIVIVGQTPEPAETEDIVAALSRPEMLDTASTEVEAATPKSKEQATEPERTATTSPSSESAPETDAEVSQGIVIVGETTEPADSEGSAIASAQSPEAESKREPAQAPIVASVPAALGTQAPAEEGIVIVSEETPAPAATVQTVALIGESEEDQPIASFDAGAACRTSVYIALDYPDGDNPISHFNIFPKGDSIWFDSGNSSGTVLGACVKGEYEYSYVYLTGPKKDKAQERKGTFQLASNGETCDVQLWDPENGAQVTCY